MQTETASSFGEYGRSLTGRALGLLEGLGWLTMVAGGVGVLCMRPMGVVIGGAGFLVAGAASEIREKVLG